jgi:hypothetical protein
MADFSESWLVKNANQIIGWLIIISAVIFSIFLVFLSIIFRDIKYPNEHPWLFTLETLLFSIGCAMITFLMAWGRTKTISKTTIIQFIVVALKFGLLHILLQFSGFYTYAFGNQ